MSLGQGLGSCQSDKFCPVCMSLCILQFFTFAIALKIKLDLWGLKVIKNLGPLTALQVIHYFG